MTEHLTDEQMMDVLSGTAADDAVRSHLAECHECAGEVARVRNGVAGFAVLMQDEAARRDLRPVPVVISRAGPIGPPRLIWVAAMLLIAVALSLLRWAPEPREQAADPAAAEDTLLLEVQQDLNREVPEALAPALVLTAERNRIIGQGRSNQNR